MTALEDLGLEVWEPFARNNQLDFLEAGWAYRIGQRDFRDVVESDAIFAIVNGVPPDEGVMVELGMAIALAKPTFLFRDDFRRVTDSEQYPLNLMLFTGLAEEGWEDYFYTSVEEITSNATQRVEPRGFKSHQGWSDRADKVLAPLFVGSGQPALAFCVSHRWVLQCSILANYATV